MRLLATASLVLGLLLSSAVTGAAAGAAPACRQVRLTQRPGFASSGAWTEKGDLLIADASRKVILRYSKDGRALGSIPESIGSALEKFFPQNIRSHRGKLILEVMGGGLIVLDKDYVPQSTTDVHAKGSRPKTNDLSIRGMFLWEPVGQADVLSFSDIHGPKETDWSSGFVRFPVDRPQDFTVLYDIKYEDPSRTFYRLGHPYIAALGNTGYILLMENHMGIFKATPSGLERLTAFPPRLNLRPQLPDLYFKEDVIPVMRAVERSTMPTGLYGWGNSLFVLWRRPEGRATHWYLTKIDPSEDKVVGTMSIGLTSANHLSVIPGPTSWAFIEKGRVRGWGLQDINSILFVPSERLRDFSGAGSALCK